MKSILDRVDAKGKLPNDGFVRYKGRTLKYLPRDMSFPEKRQFVREYGSLTEAEILQKPVYLMDIYLRTAVHVLADPKERVDLILECGPLNETELSKHPRWAVDEYIHLAGSFLEDDGPRRFIRRKEALKEWFYGAIVTNKFNLPWGGKD